MVDTAEAIVTTPGEIDDRARSTRAWTATRSASRSRWTSSRSVSPGCSPSRCRTRIPRWPRPWPTAWLVGSWRLVGSWSSTRWRSDSREVEDALAAVGRGHPSDHPDGEQWAGHPRDPPAPARRRTQSSERPPKRARAAEHDPRRHAEAVAPRDGDGAHRPGAVGAGSRPDGRRPAGADHRRRADRGHRGVASDDRGTRRTGRAPSARRSWDRSRTRCGPMPTSATTRWRSPWLWPRRAPGSTSSISPASGRRSTSYPWPNSSGPERPS